MPCALISDALIEVIRYFKFLPHGGRQPIRERYSVQCSIFGQWGRSSKVKTAKTLEYSLGFGSEKSARILF